ncbi:MAG: rcc [Chthoniobacteraceae bacterium]|nr:rcc [Chthoniobacteraceae bacterium]
MERRLFLIGRILLLFALAFLWVRPCQADLTATFNSATDVPITAGSFSAAGAIFNASLDFAPPTGTTLMVVKNTGLGFINGTFTNLAQGQAVTLGYDGINYRFIANYYGGSGNDLVLQWAKTKPIAWGYNNKGQLGDNSTTDRFIPVDVISTGVLAGKSIVAMAAGGTHSLALCSDSTLAGWGDNSYGQLGNDSTTPSSAPVLVNMAGVLAGKSVVAIASSGGHNLVLCSDGTLAAWGANDSGQLGNNDTIVRLLPTAVETSGVLAGKTIIAVAAGGSHNLALCSDGTVAAWGENFAGQLGNNSTVSSPVPVAVNVAGLLAGKKVVAISAGIFHSLALCSDGTLATWGSNSDGQLGDGNSFNRSTPVEVINAGALRGKTVVAMAAGGFHSLALCSDGTLAAWGRNSDGQLGNRNVTQSNVAVEVYSAGLLAGKTIVSLVPGVNHNLVRCSDGTVAAWGDNSLGELGNNNVPWSLEPVAVSSTPLRSGEQYAAVFGGYAHSLGLVTLPLALAVTTLDATAIMKTGATLHGAVNPEGRTATARLEYGTDTSYGSSVSVTFSPVDGFDAQNVSATLSGLAPGTTYHYRIRATNAVTTVTGTDRIFTTDATVTDVAGTFHSAADVLVTAGSFSAAGAAFNVTLNFAPPPGTNLMVIRSTGPRFIDGTFANLAQGQVITLVYGGINYQFIANYYGGSGNDLVLQWAKTRPVAWGYNGNGQVGDNSTTDRLIPVNILASGVLSDKTVVTMAAGADHSLALCSDGTLAAWGSNSWGQLGDKAPPASKRVPVAVNTSGVLSGKTIIAVAAGSFYSLALCSDGTVAAWGINNNGQLGNNTTSGSVVPVAVNTEGALAGKTVVAIAAGNDFSLALCSDGTVVAWGDNGSGELGNNNGIDSLVPVAVNTAGALAGKVVVAISAGYQQSLALCSDGTVAGWGKFLGSYNLVPVVINTAGVFAEKSVAALVAGYGHNIALCSDGALAAWGNNGSGQLGDNTLTDKGVPVAVNTAGVLADRRVVAVAAGSYHSLALCFDGTLAGWGSNEYGQLGKDGTTRTSAPVEISRIPSENRERYAAVFSGSTARHSLGLIASHAPCVLTNLAVTNYFPTGVTLNGTVKPDGSPTTAQFEYGTTPSYGSNASVTLSPNNGLSVQNVSASLSGLMPGTIYHYRLTATSALGAVIGTADGTFTTSRDVAGTYHSAADLPATFESFSAGGAMLSISLNFAPPVGTNLMVVKNTGLGFIGGTFTNLAQGQVVTLSYNRVDYRFIANYFGGSGNDLVLQWAAARLVAWGDDSAGQLGDFSTSRPYAPVDVFSTGALAGRTVISVSAGGAHTLALCSDGALFAWGNNSGGQFGNNSIASKSEPVAVTATGALAGKTIVATTAGQRHSLALCSDGTVAAWGFNSSGELGNNSLNQSLVPVPVFTAGVLSGKMIVAVAAGDSHSLALCADGTVVTWGANGFGQLGTGSSFPFNTTTPSQVPVEVVASGVLSGKKVVAIAAGSFHNLALCSDGTVVAWGANSAGQLGNDVFSTGNGYVPVEVNTTGVLFGKTVVAVAAGGSHSLALCSDGTLATWGANNYGQLGIGNKVLSRVPMAVITSGALAGKTIATMAAGLSHSLVRCSDGTVVLWGNNKNGQLSNRNISESTVPVKLTDWLAVQGDRYVALFTGPLALHNLGLNSSSPIPEISMYSPTFPGNGSVTLVGSINPNGGSVITAFDYGLNSAYDTTVSGVPATVTGNTSTIVRASLPVLLPKTTYYYRLRAINFDRITIGQELSFTTPADTYGPFAGTMTLTPGARVDAGGPLTLAFAGWTDPSPPLTYSVLIDDVVVSAPDASVFRNLSAPVNAGAYTLKGRVSDALGNFTEVIRNFTVNTAQESWRTLHFNTAQDAGAAADMADPDGDGTNNRLEYIAGLLPTNPLSHFDVRVETVPGKGDQKAIIFSPLIDGRTYSVKYKANLTDETWSALTDIKTSDNGSERTVTDLSAGAGSRLYIVEITLK